MPSVYSQILKALQSPDWPIERIAKIVATDPGLTTKILQLVNSAFFGFARNVSDADQAVMLLGLSTIRSLALTTRLFSAFEARQVAGYSVERVWGHGMRVAQLARKIAEIEGADERLVEQTFTAGLLHDVGKLILADNPSIKYLELMARAKEEGRQLVEVEEGTLHATHAEVGAYLLDLWGLPAPLVETVALHHQPAHSAEPGFTSLTAVHVANVLEQETAHETTAGPVNRLDLAYLERLGLGARVEVWRKQLSQG